MGRIGMCGDRIRRKNTINSKHDKSREVTVSGLLPGTLSCMDLDEWI